MAFPTTGILDSFGGGLGGWSMPAYPGNGNLTNPTSQLSGSIGAFSDGWWNAGTFNANQECYFTVPTRSTEVIDIYMRIVSPGGAGTVDMYDLAITGSTWEWFRIVNGAATSLTGTATQTVADGGAIGGGVITTDASTVTCIGYYMPPAGSWASVITKADTNAARLVADGFIGCQIQSNVIRVDDFGGGNATGADMSMPPVPAGTFTPGLVPEVWF